MSCLIHFCKVSETRHYVQAGDKEFGHSLVVSNVLRKLFCENGSFAFYKEIEKVHLRI